MKYVIKFKLCTVAEYNWSIANNFVIGVYCRWLEILSQIAFSSVANYFRSYRRKQFGIESAGIYSSVMQPNDFSFIAKVCTILVWYYIEGANQENESGFVYKRRIARLDWNYKEWYQTKLKWINQIYKTNMPPIIAFFIFLLIFSLFKNISFECMPLLLSSL